MFSLNSRQSVVHGHTIQIIEIFEIIFVLSSLDYDAGIRLKSWEGYPPKAHEYPFQNMYHHHYNFSKRKGGQVRFTASQTDILEKQFLSNKYLPPEKRKLLAENLQLTDRQVRL